MTMFMRLLRTAAQKHGLCVLVGIPPPLRPNHGYLGYRAGPAVLMRVMSGAERLDGGGPPGARCIFYLHE